MGIVKNTWSLIDMGKNKKRGRPKGSKNKATLLKEANQVKAPEPIIPLHPSKSFKHLGFCKCGAMIGSIDTKKGKYLCSHCGCSGKVSVLKKVKDVEVYTSKRDYLEHTLNADFHDMAPLSDEIDPNDVRVKE